MAAGAAAAGHGARRSTRRWGALLLLGTRVAEAHFEYDEGNRVESARLYGNVYKYAYYFTDLLVGHPNPQRASVIIDTGSRLVGFPCSDCDHCGDHLDPAYEVSRSETLQWRTCSDCPDTCTDGEDRCPYEETYAEGSAISGYWFDDVVEFGDAFSKNPPMRATLGCHVYENQLFYSQRASGIMGLAPMSGIKNQPSFLQSIFGDYKHVNAEVLSICLATWGGRMSIGGYDDQYHVKHERSEAIKWIELHASHYYYIRPTGLSLGGEEPRHIVVGYKHFGVTIVDSGTTFTYFPEAVFTDLRRAIMEYCQRHDCKAEEEEAVKDGSTCWQLLSADDLSGFPPIQFNFEGKIVDWWPKSYLHPVGEPDYWCLAFMESQIAQTVLGISWMIHKDVVFDLSQGLLGLADANCPEYHEQPELEQKFLAGPPAEPRLGASMHEQVALLKEAAHPGGSARGAPSLKAALAATGAIAMLASAALAVVRWLRSSASSPTDDCQQPIVYVEETSEEPPRADVQGNPM